MAFELSNWVDQGMIESNTLNDYRPPYTESLWPTDSSIVIEKSGTKYVEGSCLRAVYYRLKEYPAKPRLDPDLMWKQEIGKWFERKCQELLGIISRGKSVKFRDEKRPITFSGEMDQVFINPDNNQLELVDYKVTGGNYYANKKLLGSKRPYVKGTPKAENLMQVMTYLDFDRRLKVGHLYYLIRDSMQRVDFVIKLIPHNGKTVAEVNGDLLPDYHIEGIKERAARLHAFVASNTLPPRDFYLKYTMKRAEEMDKAGLMTDSSKDKMKKGEAVGDWKCRYCDFSDICDKDPQVYTF